MKARKVIVWAKLNTQIPHFQQAIAAGKTLGSIKKTAINPHFCTLHKNLAYCIVSLSEWILCAIACIYCHWRSDCIISQMAPHRHGQNFPKTMHFSDSLLVCP